MGSRRSSSSCSSTTPSDRCGSASTRIAQSKRTCPSECCVMAQHSRTLARTNICTHTVYTVHYRSACEVRTAFPHHTHTHTHTHNTTPLQNCVRGAHRLPPAYLHGPVRDPPGGGLDTQRNRAPQSPWEVLGHSRSGKACCMLWRPFCVWAPHAGRPTSNLHALLGLRPCLRRAGMTHKLVIIGLVGRWLVS